ncbi:ABC transporter ATP-binding protein [Streptomyces sp. NPDC002817]|uniref:ABC transporter ATP-binding protein n=1 Tax=Streptomyces sp. NPDC088357 TaxID=3154655 RepID=UPI0034287FF7
MIEVRDLTKRYGDKTAVDGLSFTVKPGEVTGFLGPNGAGKSTTMRMVIGLDAPTTGTATVNGRRYAEHSAPLQEIGALLEAKSVHPGRSAVGHLMALAHTHGIPRRRVDEVIELAGLTSVAGKRVGAFSLGMGQRLGIAAALLGDPAVVMLDEPVNGLDPEGVLWVRNLLRNLADEGRAVMLSSHLMSETALIADHLVIIGRGRLLADTTVDDFTREAGGGGVKVATAEPARLRALLAGPDVLISSGATEELLVSGRGSREIGLIAARHGVPLYELTPQSVSLEEAFMELTRDEVEYQSAPAETARKAG